MNINFVPGLCFPKIAVETTASYMQVSMQSLLTKPVLRSNYVNADVSFATKLDSYACISYSYNNYIIAHEAITQVLIHYQ